MDPSATFDEIMDLLAFSRAPGDGGGGFHPPWSDLKRRATRRQLPVIVIEEAMRRHAHDLPERKGSELNDRTRCISVTQVLGPSDGSGSETEAQCRALPVGSVAE